MFFSPQGEKDLKMLTFSPYGEKVNTDIGLFHLEVKKTHSQFHAMEGRRDVLNPRPMVMRIEAMELYLKNMIRYSFWKFSPYSEKF